MFGLIDGILFIVAAESLQKEFIKIPRFDTNMAELATGGISTACAIGMASVIHGYFINHYNVIESPLYDFFGVIIGTSILLGLYFIYKEYLLFFFNKIPELFNHHSI